jgi:hypothetical protein
MHFSLDIPSEDKDPQQPACGHSNVSKPAPPYIISIIMKGSIDILPIGNIPDFWTGLWRHFSVQGTGAQFPSQKDLVLNVTHLDDYVRCSSRESTRTTRNMSLEVLVDMRDVRENGHLRGRHESSQRSWWDVSSSRRWQQGYRTISHFFVPADSCWSIP